MGTVTVIVSRSGVFRIDDTPIGGRLRPDVLPGDASYDTALFGRYSRAQVRKAVSRAIAESTPAPRTITRHTFGAALVDVDV